MEIKNVDGEVLFAFEGEKTICELVTAAVAARKSFLNADLAGADLAGANLKGANLKDANLGDADLKGANLRIANLKGANLKDANLKDADLGGANLKDADLGGANLAGADLAGADLAGADLADADLKGANLKDANLKGAENIPPLAIAQMQFIPTEGAFIGWKKCRDRKIVKISIPSSAKRSHGTGRKARCSKAKCLAIYLQDGTECDNATSLHDPNFIYRVGKVATPDGFDDDRWNTCGSGIHFYITREEAQAH